MPKHIWPLYRPTPYDIRTGVLPTAEQDTLHAEILTGDDAYFHGMDEPCLRLPDGTILPLTETKELVAKMEVLAKDEPVTRPTAGGGA